MKFDLFLTKCKSNCLTSDKQLSVLLGLAGSILLAGVLFFCFYIPLTPGRMERASTTLFNEFGPWEWISSLQCLLTNDSLWVGVLLITVTLFMFTVYSIALALTWRRRPTKLSVRVFFSISILMFVISALALPNQNTDIFNYITQARVATVNDSNPHYVPASNFPDDPVYPYASARITQIVGDKLAAWTWLSIPLAEVAGNDPAANLLLFRLAFLLFNIGNLFLIFLILKKTSLSHTLSGLVFYAWNPIVAVSGQSKTDTVMVFFLLVGIYFLVTNKRYLAIIAIAISFLVKAITLLIIVIHWVHQLWNHHYKALILSVLFFCVTVVCIYYPLWEGPQLVSNHLGVIMGEFGASTIKFSSFNKNFLLLLFGALILASGVFKEGDHKTLIKRCAIVMLFFSIFLARISNSWYLITSIAVVALTQEWKISVITLAVTFSAFLFNVWYSTSTQLFKLPELFDNSRFVIFLIPIAIVGLIITSLTIWKKLRSPKPVLTI